MAPVFVCPKQGLLEPPTYAAAIVVKPVATNVRREISMPTSVLPMHGAIVDKKRCPNNQCQHIKLAVFHFIISSNDSQSVLNQKKINMSAKCLYFLQSVPSCQ